MPSEPEKYTSMRAILGYVLVARNGASGVLEDVLFSDRNGAVRHVVFDRSRWLPKHYLLLDPDDLGPVDPIERNFPVLLTDEEFEARPQMQLDPPVSKQNESHSGIEEGKGFWSLLVARKHRFENLDDKTEIYDPHLRSAREIIGYDLRARDGEAGTLTDVLFDQTNWAVRYLVVAAGTILDRRQVLLRVDDIDEVSWEARSVHTPLLMKRIANLPVFDRASQTSSPRPQGVHDQFAVILGGTKD